MTNKYISALKNENFFATFGSTYSEHEDFFKLLEALKEDKVSTVDGGNVEIQEDLVGVSTTGYLLKNLETGERFPIPEFAFRSIRARAGNNSEVLSKLIGMNMRGKAAEMLNMSWPLLEGTPLLIYSRGGNLLGLHSRQYVALPQEDVYREAEITMEVDHDNLEFISASYSHTKTIAEYRVGHKSARVKYAKALTAAGVVCTAGDISFQMRIETSDTADSSVMFLPQVIVKHYPGVIPITIPVRVNHRDTATIAKVASAATSTYGLMEEAVEHLEFLLKIELKHPSGALWKITKTRMYNIPVKPAKELAIFFNKEATGETMTAHDFYLTLSRVIEIMEKNGAKAEEILRTREGLGKILKLSANAWADLDDNPAKSLLT